MTRFLAPLVLTTALTVPSLALARPLTFTVQMTPYSGLPAYVALYVTNDQGAYVGSLWMAGHKAKYYRHLRGWAAATGGDRRQVDGITGASVGPGRELKVTLNLKDALFDAGYVLHVDAAVENQFESPNEVVVPLTKANLGSPAKGRRYVQSVTVSE